jgi:hypothetical protein
MSSQFFPYMWYKRRKKLFLNYARVKVQRSTLVTLWVRSVAAAPQNDLNTHIYQPWKALAFITYSQVFRLRILTNRCGCGTNGTDKNIKSQSTQRAWQAYYCIYQEGIGFLSTGRENEICWTRFTSFVEQNAFIL